MPATKANRTVENNYREQLLLATRQLKMSTALVSDFITPETRRQDAAKFIETQINSTLKYFNEQVPASAESFVSASSQKNKGSLENSIAKGFGVSYANIIDEPNVADALALSLTENVSLIKTIHSKHWGKVIRAVQQNYSGISPQGKTLTQRLRSLGPISDRHALLVARDQTNKLNGSLTQIRHQNIGITSYVWVTAGQDERVVGNPSGLYPKPTNVYMHGNHFNRNGKTFYYARPPADGNPGMGIQCRCFAKPVIYLDNLNAGYV